ncbi:hypothetical protein N7517_009715 [Penicillium concentricum]|uniref:Uncharacterized protein n=1 Tax=Penicillium concentricum TaxID=293559 RepID=A0A9W9RJN9_9EURO|nr:uncharacterized protein N7517_009715 [Penicillium concentricum]KAJ5360524.1 hypothetical protein N7517_009715 [Penicillium concentricum]
MKVVWQQTNINQRLSLLEEQQHEVDQAAGLGINDHTTHQETNNTTIFSEMAQEQGTDVITLNQLVGSSLALDVSNFPIKTSKLDNDRFFKLGTCDFVNARMKSPTLSQIHVINKSVMCYAMYSQPQETRFEWRAQSMVRRFLGVWSLVVHRSNRLKEDRGESRLEMG